MKKALALKYVRSLPAPFILAKGRGQLAEKIERAARAAGVAVAEDGGLAELLYPLELGTCVPESYYEVVAALFAWLAKMKETR